VTLLAACPEATGMHVVTRMTRAADHRWLDDVLRPDVAVGTPDPGMGTQQREASVRRMVEVPHLPSIRCMTFAAILAEPTLMSIVVRMAAEAIPGRFIESLRCVTLTATHDHMQSSERIVRLVVIEVHLLPLRGCMALLALLAQRPTVGFVRPMAIDALRPELLILRYTGMTGVAIEVCMRTIKSKLEAREMIKLRHAPYVVAVAVGTRRPEASRVHVVRLVAARTIPG
jgi:hypothetical protein